MKEVETNLTQLEDIYDELYRHCKEKKLPNNREEVEEEEGRGGEERSG